MEIVVPALNFSDSVPGIPKSAMENARLFSSRHEMIKELPTQNSVIEIGVAYGDFSEDIVRAIRPRKFIAVDHFGLEKYDLVWGEDPRKRLGKLTHEDFYRQRMESLAKELNFTYEHKAGNSAKKILEVSAFDFAYIDAGHSYEDVELDTRATILRLNEGGHIFFNDYIWRDTFNGGVYGVVRTVNQLVNEGGWEVRGLALNPMMFCDIWLQKTK